MSLADSIADDIRLLRGQLPPSAKPIIDRLSNNIDALIADDQDAWSQSKDNQKRLADTIKEHEQAIKRDRPS